MLIEMRAWLPGERVEGEEWPRTGGRVDVPAEQAQELIDIGYAIAVGSEEPTDEAAGPDAPPTGPADTDLSNASRAELVAAAETAGLPASGTKAELLERLTEADAG